MVTVKDLGETVELTLHLPVEEKEVTNIANKTGYTFADLKSSYLFVTMTTMNFIEFVQDVMAAHTKFQEARARAVEKSFDCSSRH